MSEIWPDCMIESHASVGAGLSCKGYGALLKERDALAARLAEAEALLREWADSGVEYKSSKYRLTQIDHRTYLETVNFLAAGSAPAGDIPLRERLDPDGPGEGGRMKFSAPAVACKTCGGTGREPVMIAGEWGVEWGSANCSTCKADQPPFPRAVRCSRCGLWLAPLAAHECPSDQPELTVDLPTAKGG